MFRYFGCVEVALPLLQVLTRNGSGTGCGSAPPPRVLKTTKTVRGGLKLCVMIPVLKSLGVRPSTITLQDNGWEVGGGVIIVVVEAQTPPPPSGLKCNGSGRAGPPISLAQCRPFIARS